LPNCTPAQSQQIGTASLAMSTCAQVQYESILLDKHIYSHSLFIAQPARLQLLRDVHVGDGCRRWLLAGPGLAQRCQIGVRCVEMQLLIKIRFFRKPNKIAFCFSSCFPSFQFIYCILIKKYVERVFYLYCFLKSNTKISFFFLSHTLILRNNTTKHFKNFLIFNKNKYFQVEEKLKEKSLLNKRVQ
jgi:hypothetical protein